MVSETSICNQALSWVGQEEINSLDEKSKGAQWCRNNYPWLRDAMLESRMWTFATVKEVSTSADNDAWGVLFKHLKPVNWISVFRVYRILQSNGNMIPDNEWRMEEGAVVSRWSTVYLWGVERITDTGVFSPLFVQALAARMASDMAIPMAQNRQLQIDLWNIYEAKLAEAAARDGQQGANDVITQNRLVDARYSNGLGGM